MTTNSSGCSWFIDSALRPLFSCLFFPQDLVTAAQRQPTGPQSASYNWRDNVLLLLQLIQQMPMDSALPKETLVVALSLAAARVLAYAAGYCLLSQTEALKRSQQLGQLFVSIFLCCATAVAVSFAYGRFKDAYTREAVSVIFVSLSGAEVGPTGGCDFPVLTRNRVFDVLCRASAGSTKQFRYRPTFFEWSLFCK